MITPHSLALFMKPVSPITSSSFLIAMTVPKHLPYFDGHFPENPILPGVAMVDLSQEALRVYVEEMRPLIGLRSAKYLGMVQPNDSIQISCVKNSPDEWQIVWTKEDKKICDLVLNFG